LAKKGREEGRKKEDTKDVVNAEGKLKWNQQNR
jgi:hypothetical protein